MEPFPTQQRKHPKEADKRANEAGIVKNKKNHYVEPHFDDCGSDMGPLLYLDALSFDPDEFAARRAARLMGAVVAMAWPDTKLPMRHLTGFRTVGRLE